MKVKKIISTFLFSMFIISTLPANDIVPEEEINQIELLATDEEPTSEETFWDKNQQTFIIAGIGTAAGVTISGLITYLATSFSNKKKNKENKEYMEDVFDVIS